MHKRASAKWTNWLARQRRSARTKRVRREHRHAAALRCRSARRPRNRPAARSLQTYHAQGAIVAFHAEIVSAQQSAVDSDFGIGEIVQARVALHNFPHLAVGEMDVGV